MTQESKFHAQDKDSHKQAQEAESGKASPSHEAGAVQKPAGSVGRNLAARVMKP